MPSAPIAPETNQFPKKCPHCGRKAEGTYAVAAVRGLDAYIGGYAVPVLFDVPVCREAFERRRTAAVVALAVVLVSIVGGAGLAIWFAFHGAWLAAALPAAVAVALAAGGRTGWDAALLDRHILGLSARSVSSSQARLRFSRGEYYEQWAKLNHVKRT
ncbi:MAG TPA: hypothetical protein VGI12_03620 [Vicinamibacterales bacterium]